MITQKRLKELLHYDPVTGCWSRLIVGSNRYRNSDKVGTIDPYGYRIIRIDGRNYRSSRLAWLYMTGSFPEKFIDHIDRDSVNDSWANLREASASENNYNRSLEPTNTSGHKGVSWRKDFRKWQAYINANKKMYHLGYFDTIDEAIVARKIAENKFHGEYAAKMR